LIRLLATAFCQFGTFLFSKFISDKSFMKNM
jgi:hypothetical protein